MSSSENDRNVVHVLTAGGAASPARKRKDDPRSVSFTANLATAAESDRSRTFPSSSAVETNNATTHAAIHQLELESSATNLDFAARKDVESRDQDMVRRGDTKGLLLLEDVNLEDSRDRRHHHLDQHHRQRTASGSLRDDDEVDSPSSSKSDLLWLLICFLGIMGSFVIYGLLMEYTTSGGRKLHELSFLFVTSGLYTLTAAAGRYVRDETPTTIPPARFAVLGLTSMGSTWCSVRSLRYVIYPIQVLAKSCKPVPVMLMGTLMGKRYPLRKYVNVLMIVTGVAMFMGGGDGAKKKHTTTAAAGDESSSSSSSPSQIIGILLLFISLSFDGFTGSYEDKLMAVHSVQPFDLMYNIQLGKTILAGIGLVVFNQLHVFIQMVQDMGLMLVALGLSGAIGQVFIFVTIAKFGALTCSIIGLARKITTLVASIYFYGHALNSLQFAGLIISVGSMVMNFMGKGKGKGKGGGGGEEGHHGHAPSPPPASDELEKMLDNRDADFDANDDRGGSGGGGTVELTTAAQQRYY